jgi:single-strand DNA-binding protein
MNKAILMGNITRDIELRNTPSGAVVANFSIATNESVKKGENWENLTTFHDIVAWGKNAENISRFFGKGSKILIEGNIRKRDWTDKSGAKRTQTEILLERFEFVEKMTKKEDNQYSQPEPEFKDSQELPENEDEIKIEDIPF